MAGLTACFSDPYTRETMGPDGANFSDLSTAVSLQVEEQPVRGKAGGKGSLKALWFLKAKDNVAAPAFNAA